MEARIQTGALSAVGWSVLFGWVVFRLLAGNISQSFKLNQCVNPSVNPGMYRMHQLQDKEKNNYPNLLVPPLQIQDYWNSEKNAEAPPSPKRDRSSSRFFKFGPIQDSLEFTLFSNLRIQSGGIVQLDLWVHDFFAERQRARAVTSGGER